MRKIKLKSRNVTTKNFKGPLRQMRLLAAILAVVLALGCIGASPSEGLATTTLTTIQSMHYEDTSSLTASTIATQSSTLPAPEEDGIAICLEARANKSLYDRCKMAASGELFLSQSELRKCAQIQQNAGAYAEAIFHGLQYCVGDPTGSAFSCNDMGQPDRDQCYLSVSMCDPIEDADVKNQCLSGQQINKI